MPTDSDPRPDAAADPPPQERAWERWLPTPLLRASAGVHLAALGLLLLRPRRWRLALGLAVADHLLLLAASLTPRSPLIGPNLRRLGPAAAARGEVALSFDDGPDPRVTPRVLDLLEAAGARASFFVIGRRAAAHPELTRQIARRGHRVENHTWSHPHGFAFTGPGAMGEQIDRAQRLLGELTGRPPVWFRPPAGMRNPLLAGVLAGRGLGLASWSRRGFDGLRADPGAVVGRLTRGLAAGDVLLLHDGSSLGARTERQARTVLSALPRVLDGLERRGLTAVPLPDYVTAQQGDDPTGDPGAAAPGAPR